MKNDKRNIHDALESMFPVCIVLSAVLVLILSPTETDKAVLMALIAVSIEVSRFDWKDADESSNRQLRDITMDETVTRK